MITLSLRTTVTGGIKDSISCIISFPKNLKAVFVSARPVVKTYTPHSNQNVPALIPDGDFSCLSYLSLSIYYIILSGSTL